MTDPTHTSETRPQDRPIREAVEANLKRRHAKERRFRAYGLAAIGFAAFMLVILLASIGYQAVSAFRKNFVVAELTLDPAVVVPAGADAAEDIAENVSGFYTLVRGNLIETFDVNADSISESNAVASLVTRLAVLPVARKVSRDQDLIGETETFRFALNDDLDLYLKGRVSDEIVNDVTGGTVSRSSGETVAIEGDFTTLLGDVKSEVRALAENMTSEIEETEFRRNRFSDQIETDGATAELEAGLKAAEDALTGLIAERDRLIAQSEDADLAETLDASLPSVLVRVGDTFIKLETVATDRVEGMRLAGPLPPRGAIEGAVETRLIETPESARAVSDQQIAWVRSLKRDGRIKTGFNWALLTNADSTYPEIAGAIAAIVGSLFTILITALLSLPIGIAAAVYLEEYAPKNRLTSLIEVNINNLAAVPSIVFGLLGAAVFLGFFGMPRSAPLVGGLVLALLTLPTVIIASRAALKAVPPSIRDAALGLGASRTQAVFHHVVPLAAPGMMTGAIIGLARALGETAPLLLIGMVAFVNEVPTGPGDEATALPVLIFKWSTGAERAWEPLTAAVIVVLLLFMIMMNALAVFLRRRFERRW